MKNKGEVAPNESRSWTRAEDYLGALAQQRSIRHKRKPSLRSQPESPRLLLSTVPFVVLLASMALLAVAIMILAWPGNQPRARAHTVQHEQGIAAKGWFQEAQKEFR